MNTLLITALRHWSLRQRARKIVLLLSLAMAMTGCEGGVSYQVCSDEGLYSCDFKLGAHNCDGLRLNPSWTGDVLLQKQVCESETFIETIQVGTNLGTCEATMLSEIFAEEGYTIYGSGYITLNCLSAGFTCSYHTDFRCRRSTKGER